ncbi:omptin family outer membrane protease [Desulfovibrio aminophilus]|nr:omptin family outer membrane protease [Desulfovibrio aminophilus]MCM0753857.1 omptin family outer membrane protease [Desulfovibrio aminophilus]
MPDSARGTGVLPARRRPGRGGLYPRAASGVLLLVLLLCAPAAPLGAEPGPAEPTATDWSFELKTKVLMDSFTAYEFGMPLPPQYAPLSRLEFEMDSVWAGFSARRRLDRFSLGLEYLSSSLRQEGGHMRDSDWEDPADTGRLTTFSKSECTLRPSFQISADLDMQAADLLGLGPEWDLRPFVGFRLQELSFLAHDGTQWEYDPPYTVTPLPGHSIAFRQTWRQYFLGLALGYDWGPVLGLRHFKTTGRADVAYVQGDNRDDHLLRPDRITREETEGYAVHAVLGLTLGLAENLDLGLEGEYLGIETTGVHKLHDGWVGLDMQWNKGVHVWSRQTSLQLSLAYSF